MDGPVVGTVGKAVPGKDDPRAHKTCPFAAAAQPAPIQDFIALAAPELSSARRAAPFWRGWTRAAPLLPARLPRPAIPDLN